MAALLLTGAAGQGKTHEVLQRIKKLLRKKLFGKIWVLLPTELQIGTFRTRLLKEVGEAAHFGVEFFDFYDLYARLLELAGTPQRQIMDAARFRILRESISEVADQLQYFNAIAQTPGFVDLAASFIEELKQAQITPEDFDAGVQTVKDYDMALIYTAYQNFLRQKDLVDRDGEGWLAVASVGENQSIDLNIDLLVVDGYDQFNPVQINLLALLTNYAPDMLLTLTYEPERAETAHRRFAQTREQLLRSGVWAEQKLTGQKPVMRQPSLDHLSLHLFDTYPQPLDNDGSLRMIEAPGRHQESQQVLRDVKRLLLAGIQPEQIAIVARDLNAYTPYFVENAAAYGIPLAMKRGTPLAQNPAVAAFLGLIDLPANNFRRRQVMDALHSPYLNCPYFTDEQIAKLELVSRGQIIVRSREQWLQGISAAAALQETEDYEWRTDALTAEESETLSASINQFFDRVTPSKRATVREFVRWLEDLIGPEPDADEPDEDRFKEHFALIQHIRDNPEAGLVVRDIAAVDCLKRLFLEILSAYDLVDPYTPISWETFRQELQTAVDSATVNLSRLGNRLGRVLLASVYEVRGLPHDYVFLIGLSEGEFPARTPENVLFTDAERRQMQERGLAILTSTQDTDEGSLFYEVTALAQQALTLTRPYINDGNDWPASPYWRAVRQLIKTDVTRIPLAQNATLDDAARISELMVALAEALNGEITPASAGVHNWIMSQPALYKRWLSAVKARDIEIGRTSRDKAHNEYTGKLSNDLLKARVAQMLDEDRLWSASQFNEFGTCPFQFFAKRLLKLESLEEPEEGIDQLQLGTLYHEILELTYRKIDYENIRICADNAERAQTILNEVMEKALVDAPKRHGFRPGALWEHEKDTLRRKLVALVARDFSDDSPIDNAFNKGGASPRYTTRQEVRFGFDQQQALIIHGNAGALRIRGAIDRVDEINGNLVVIDYKTGSTTFNADDMVEGRNVQMMLYMYAAKQLLNDKQVKGGAFWHISSQKISGEITADHESIEAARETLHERVLDGRKGMFINTPSKRTPDGYCSNYCQFNRLCRVERGNSQKPV